MPSSLTFFRDAEESSERDRDRAWVVAGGVALTVSALAPVVTSAPSGRDDPLIGGLFGNSNRRTSETELYLFLTPRILKTDADVDSVTVPRLRHGAPR